MFCSSTRLLLGIAAIAVHLQIESGRLPEEVEGLARRRRAGGLLAGLEQVLLGLRGLVAPAVVVREHAVEVVQPIGVDPLDCARHVPMERLARSLQHRLVDRLLHDRMGEDVLALREECPAPYGARPVRLAGADQLAVHQVAEDGVEVADVAEELPDDMVLE